MPAKRKHSESTLDNPSDFRRQTRSRSNKNETDSAPPYPNEMNTATRKTRNRAARKEETHSDKLDGERTQQPLPHKVTRRTRTKQVDYNDAGTKSEVESDSQGVQDISNFNTEVAPRRRGRPPRSESVNRQELTGSTLISVSNSNTPNDCSTTDTIFLGQQTRQSKAISAASTRSNIHMSSDTIFVEQNVVEELNRQATIEEEDSDEVLQSQPVSENPQKDPSLLGCFFEQKRIILKTLRTSNSFGDESGSGLSMNNTATQQLQDLLKGTTERAEGNSCLLLGPRGSGKSTILEACIRSLQSEAIVLRLSGWVQTTDRHALQEIAFQLLQQTGSSLLPDEETNISNLEESHTDEENPFLETQPDTTNSLFSLPPTTHLHALIPLLLTLKQPVIVILDCFDLFALHLRQSLLYCLLDAVQNCRANSDNRGIAVIGVTSRMDTIQLLEKRVKSRFSGRTIRTVPPGDFDACISFVRHSLKIPLGLDVHAKQVNDWNVRWSNSIESFLADVNVTDVLKETYSISRDLTLIKRILVHSVLHLLPEHPFLSHKHILASVELQRSRPPELHFNSLPYPSICLLVASVHVNTSGHVSFTFEMLFENFRDQMRASQSAPVQVNGGSIGMVKCTREVMMTAFEGLAAAKAFALISGTPSTTAKEFIKYRSLLDRAVVKKIVEKTGQTHLKKWLHKAQ